MRLTKDLAKVIMKQFCAGERLGYLSETYEVPVDKLEGVIRDRLAAAELGTMKQGEADLIAAERHDRPNGL